MAVGIAVSYNGSYHSPGFDITVTGLTNYNKLTIERVDPSGEFRDATVRGADQIAIAGAAFSVTDFEAPIGKILTYRVSAEGDATVPGGSLTDTFTRTVSSGWGSGSGLTWTLKAGTAANASVNGSVAKVAITTNSDPLTMTLAPTLSDFDFYFDVSSDAVSTGAQIVGAFVSGYVDESNGYRWEMRFMPDATLDVLIRRQVSGTFVNLAVHNDVVTYSANAWYSVRAKSTAGVMQVKVWPQGGAEPATWWAETTADTTFASGLIGLQAFTGGANSNAKPVSVSFDNVIVPDSGGVPITDETVLSLPTPPAPPDTPGTVWLKSVGQPALSRRVNMVDFDDVARPGRILGEYEVLGRSNKIVLTDVLSGREGTFTIATYQMGGVWESDSNWRDIQLLFQLGETLFLQTAGAEYTGEQDMYLEVKSVNRKRIGVVGGELVHLHTIDFVEVDRPSTAEESLTLRDWQDVIDQNGTWDAVLTNHTTWLDVLQRNL